MMLLKSKVSTEFLKHILYDRVLLDLVIPGVVRWGNIIITALEENF